MKPSEIVPWLEPEDDPAVMVAYTMTRRTMEAWEQDVQNERIRRANRTPSASPAGRRPRSRRRR